jgi:uncharacterized SAM-binding protein YcdF (DUF218 family)
LIAAYARIDWASGLFHAKNSDFPVFFSLRWTSSCRGLVAMIKPVLTALILPPLGLLLVAWLGWLLAARGRRAGLTWVALALTLLWVLSCHGTAVWLARHLLVQYPPASAGALKSAGVQAIVILGGGVLPEAPEYAEPQLRAETAARLRYGIWLARQTGLPIAFSGGKGWAARETQTESESQVAQRVARADYHVELRWLEDQSRDTLENAQQVAPLLRQDGIQKIALVTHAWHMPRAMEAFGKTAMQTVPAPMGFVLPNENPWLEWLPSGQGLLASRLLLREWLGLKVARLSAP